jgi:hypothetical protein
LLFIIDDNARPSGGRFCIGRCPGTGAANNRLLLIFVNVPVRGCGSIVATGAFDGAIQMTASRIGISEMIKRGVIAGAAGGLAEIIWVSAYAIITGGNATSLARGVTTAAGVSALLPSAPVTTGIVVHMALAVLLGIAVSAVWQAVSVRSQGVSNAYVLVIAALSGVWAMNFFVVLPAISPEFVQLVPYSVSLMSKLLFGLAAAETLRHCASANELAAATVRVRV